MWLELHDSLREAGCWWPASAFQLAEDGVQDAFEAAVTSWRRDGVPANPGRQDRSLWDQDGIREGLGALERAVRLRRLGAVR